MHILKLGYSFYLCPYYCGYMLSLLLEKYLGMKLLALKVGVTRKCHTYGYKKLPVS